MFMKFEYRGGNDYSNISMTRSVAKSNTLMNAISDNVALDATLIDDVSEWESLFGEFIEELRGKLPIMLLNPKCNIFHEIESLLVDMPDINDGLSESEFEDLYRGMLKAIRNIISHMLEQPILVTHDKQGQKGVELNLPHSDPLLVNHSRPDLVVSASR